MRYFTAKFYLATFKRSFYNTITQPFDIAFCLDDEGWSLVKPVASHIISHHSDLKIVFLARATKNKLPADFDWTNQTVFCGVALHMRKLFCAKLVYAPFLELSRAWKSKNSMLIHAIHSMNSLDATFPDHYFDDCDYIMCAGPHHLQSFKSWSSRRKRLLGKRLIKAGYPKLDGMLARNAARQKPSHSPERLTVVYAPTHAYEANESLASLRAHGYQIVQTLLASGFHVIFRPHPASLISKDRVHVDRICDSQVGNPNFSLDTAKDYFGSYAAADLMVTDLSGTGFTFSLGFSRPCIFFVANQQAERGFSGIQFEERHRVGTVVRDTDQLAESLRELREESMSGKIEIFRSEILFNVGRSADYISGYIASIARQANNLEWIEL
jgi:hypothetical protein